MPRDAANALLRSQPRLQQAKRGGRDVAQPPTQSFRGTQAKSVYTVYQVVGPNDAAYIGCTSQPLARRWREHYTMARDARRTAPFMAAIREHGAGAFTVRSVAEYESAPEAFAAETALIAKLSKAGVLLYNVFGRGGRHRSFHTPRRRPMRAPKVDPLDALIDDIIARKTPPAALSPTAPAQPPLGGVVPGGSAAGAELREASV